MQARKSARASVSPGVNFSYLIPSGNHARNTFSKVSPQSLPLGGGHLTASGK